MNLLDREVFAVLTAIITIVSMFSAAMIAKPSDLQHFVAISLLNQDCEIGDYPSYVFNGTNVTLCLRLVNELERAYLFQIRYKLGTNATIPTNSTPSPEQTIAKWNLLLNRNENLTIEVSVPIKVNEISGLSKEVAIIFELWYLDPDSNMWVYTGKWVHLYITVAKQVLEGG